MGAEKAHYAATESLARMRGRFIRAKSVAQMLKTTSRKATNAATTVKKKKDETARKEVATRKAIAADTCTQVQASLAKARADFAAAKKQAEEERAAAEAIESKKKETWYAKGYALGVDCREKYREKRKKRKIGGDEVLLRPTSDADTTVNPAGVEQ